LFKLEAINDITFWGLKLESTGGWRRQRATIKTIGSHSLIAFDKCLTRMPNMRVNLSEQIYEMICESRMLYGAVIFFLGGGVEFSMKVLRNS